MKTIISIVLILTISNTVLGQWSNGQNPHLLTGNPHVVGPDPIYYLEMDEDTSKQCGLIFQYDNGPDLNDKAKFLFLRETNEFIFSKVNVNPPAAPPTLTLDLNQPQITSLSTPGYVRFGSLTGNHMEFDHNEIQSKRTAISPATLYLNYRGGDVSIGTDNFYFDESTDRIGIGTSSPTEVLDVNGKIKSTSHFVLDKIGIGISDPTEKLHVVGTSKFTDKVVLGDNIEMESLSPTITMINDANNKLGFLGQSSASMQMYSQTDIQFFAQGDILATMTVSDSSLDVNGHGNFTGELTAASDARFKKDIIPIQNALNTIQALNPVSYEFRDEEFSQMNFSDDRRYGLIAQEVEQFLPELVSIKGEQDYRSLNYIDLIPFLIRGMQEQQEMIQQQENIIQGQQDLLNAVRLELDQLKLRKSE